MIGEAKQCSITETLCVTKAELKYVTENAGKDCSCLPKCKSIEYTTVLSHSLAGHFFMDTLNKRLVHKTRDFIGGHYCLLNVYFSSLTVTKITDKPAYSGIALLSNIGGAFGLILGSTVFGVLEILDFFIFGLMDYYVLKKTRR